jgi:hypothetical protein
MYRSAPSTTIPSAGFALGARERRVRVVIVWSSHWSVPLRVMGSFSDADTMPPIGQIANQDRAYALEESPHICAARICAGQGFGCDTLPRIRRRRERR